MNIALLNLDILGECVFGIKIDSLNNPEHPFALNALEFFKYDADWCRLLSVAAPKLAKFFRFEFFKESVTKYFGGLTDKIISDRKSRNEMDKGQGKLKIVKNS